MQLSIQVIVVSGLGQKYMKRWPGCLSNQKSTHFLTMMMRLNGFKSLDTHNISGTLIEVEIIASYALLLTEIYTFLIPAYVMTYSSNQT